MFDKANRAHFYLDVEGFEDTGLQVLAFDGVEGLNSEFVFEITLVNKHVRYDITQLLSKSAYLAFTPDKKNGVHGVIHAVKRGAVGSHYAQYNIILAPRFTHLHKRFNQRAFVGKAVPEIISTILAEYGQQQGQEFTYKFKETYPAREFCCQYEESDADFIYRLCEEEGIAIHYQFDQSNHNMVFTDAQPFFPNLSQAIHYMSDTGFVADQPVLKRFDVGLSSATQTVAFRNYNFTNMKIPEGTAKGQQSDKANEAQEPNLESYDYPNPHMDKGQGDRLAQREIERLRANHILAEGYSDIPNLHAGYFFSVTGYPAIDTLDTDKPWLIKQIKHQGRQPQVIEALGDASSADSSTMPSQLDRYYRLPIAEELQFPTDSFQQGYRNCLVATPQAVPYRPARFHPRPEVLGTQTAIITGATGEEIYCDEYGRIKLQFHWDREGGYDENSSHWIRVASSWAHDGYGAVVIPRVGMEVTVSFLEGDIDNPVVTGALHNGVNKVPYDLPANKTRSVFKTSSSKGGIGSNELRIEDKAGQEQIFVQSQKDFDQLTKNNHTVQVNNNSHLQVNNEHSETIKKNRYTKNEMEEHHLTQLDRKTQIMMNDHKTVGISQHETIGTIKVTEAGMEIHLKSGLQTVIDGGLSLTLKAGGQHIILNPAGIWMTTPQWMGGIPMVGAPAIPVAPLNKLGAVIATAAPPVTPVQIETFKKDAPFCFECMLNSLGACLTDFSNKTTPSPILDKNITLDDLIVNGGIGGGGQKPKPNLTLDDLIVNGGIGGGGQKPKPNLTLDDLIVNGGIGGGGQKPKPNLTLDDLIVNGGIGGGGQKPKPNLTLDDLIVNGGIGGGGQKPKPNLTLDDLIVNGGIGGGGQKPKPNLTLDDLIVNGGIGGGGNKPKPNLTLDDLIVNGGIGGGGNKPKPDLTLDDLIVNGGIGGELPSNKPSLNLSEDDLIVNGGIGGGKAKPKGGRS